MATLRSPTAPYQRRRELQRIGRTEPVDAEQALRAVADLIGGLHVVPPAAQIVEPRQRLLPAGDGQRLLTVEPMQVSAGELTSVAQGLALFLGLGTDQGQTRV